MAPADLVTMKYARWATTPATLSAVSLPPGARGGAERFLAAFSRKLLE